LLYGKNGREEQNEGLLSSSFMAITESVQKKEMSPSKESMADVRFAQGLTDKQIEQLVAYSTDKNDKAIQNFTSDAERFPNKEAVMRWLEGRSVYNLTNADGDLLGMSGLGKKSMPERKPMQPFDASEYGVTFMIRMYGPARGKRLSGPLTDFAIHEYKQTEEYQALENKGIWLKTSDTNKPAIKSYIKTGFVQVTEPDEENKILMIKEG
jgi:hypothetical protein